MPEDEFSVGDLFKKQITPRTSIYCIVISKARLKSDALERYFYIDGTYGKIGSRFKHNIENNNSITLIQSSILDDKK